MDIHASSLERAMYCAGSLFFKDLPPQEPSEAAKEGTAAGEYLENVLMGKPISTHASNGVPFDEDMKFFAEQTVKQIPNYVEVHCETRVNWALTQKFTLKGRLDISFVKDGVLYVDDYKYGFGLVEVEKNWQLLAYAIGEIIRLGEAFKAIRLRIHQPRPHHEDGPTRTWEISYEQLVSYKRKIQERFKKIEEENYDHLMTGPYCKYCPAAASCPAFNKAFYRGVEVVQDFVQDDLNEEELSFQLDLVNRIEDLVKTRKSSLEQLAIHRLKQNKLIPNYVTQERYGHRKWNPGVTAESIKLMTGIDISKQDLLSPSQAEKRGMPEQLMDSLTKRPLLGQKLKRVDTKKLGDKIFGLPK